MQRLFTILVGCLLLAGIAYGDTGATSRLMSTGKSNEFIVGSEGEIVTTSSITAGGTLSVTGASTLTGAVDITGALAVTNGLVVVEDGGATFTNVPAKSSGAYYNTRTNDNEGSITLAVNATTLYSISKDDVGDMGLAPRNFKVVIRSTETADDSTKIVGTIAIDGWNANGIATSESIILTTTAVEGNVAWAVASTFTVTLSTWNVGGVTTGDLWIGNGDKLGLSNNLIDDDDMFCIIETATQRDPTAATQNTTYDTVVPENVPDGAIDYIFRYKAKAQ